MVSEGVGKGKVKTPCTPFSRKSTNRFTGHVGMVMGDSSGHKFKGTIVRPLLPISTLTLDEMGLVYMVTFMRVKIEK